MTIMRLKLLIQKSNIAPNGLRFYSNCILSDTYILLLMIRFGVDYIDSDSEINHVCKTFITLHVYDRLFLQKIHHFNIMRLETILRSLYQQILSIIFFIYKNDKLKLYNF